MHSDQLLFTRTLCDLYNNDIGCAHTWQIVHFWYRTHHPRQPISSGWRTCPHPSDSRTVSCKSTWTILFRRKQTSQRTLPFAFGINCVFCWVTWRRTLIPATGTGVKAVLCAQNLKITFIIVHIQINSNSNFIYICVKASVHIVHLYHNNIQHTERNQQWWVQSEAIP